MDNKTFTFDTVGFKYYHDEYVKKPDNEIKQRVSSIENAIGSGGSVDDRIDNAVKDCLYKTPQTLSVEEKDQIQQNIGVKDRLDLMQAQYEALTQSDIEITDTVPTSGVPNKIYRVVGTNSYSDYMFSSSDLHTPIKMALYDNATDDEPIPGSNNLVKSGGVAQLTVVVSNSIQSSGLGRYLLKDGTFSLQSTSHNFVNKYEINPTYTYYASGRIPPQLDSCFVAYYDENNQFISYEVDGGERGIVEDNYKLTVPNTAKYINVTGSDSYNPTLKTTSISSIVTNIQNNMNPSGELSPYKIEEHCYLLQDGTYFYKDNMSWYVFTYKNVGYKNLIASGRTGETQGGCSIGYYTKENQFLGYEKPFEGTAENYSNYALTVPNNTYYIKVCGRLNATSLTGTSSVDTNFLAIQDVNSNIKELSDDISTINALNLKDKNVAIIGASIDTHGNDGSDSNAVEIIIEPEDVGQTLSAYITYDDVQEGLSIGGRTFTTEDIGNEVTFVPTLDDVGKKVGLPHNYNDNSLKVWWMYVKEKFGCNIIPVCWSGSGYTTNRQTGSSKTYYTSHAWHDAQIRKCGIRTPGTMNRTAPDVIFLCRGLNDWTHSPYAVITENYFDKVDWQYPTTDKNSNGDFGYLEGISLTIKKLRETYPFTPIVLFTHIPCKRVNNEHFPANNGLFNLPQYNNAIRQAADFFGCQLVDRAKSSITWENMYPTYVNDSQSTPTHPNAKGHEVLGKFVVSELAKLNFDV